MAFADMLSERRFALTVEIVPPLTLDPEAVMAQIRPLNGLADAINVTDNAAARASIDPLAVSALMVREGLEPIVQLNCRDRNRLGLEASLMGAIVLGVRAFLFLTGDDPTSGEQPDTKPVFDLNSSELARIAKEIAAGRLPDGREIDAPVPILAGIGETPLDPPKGWEPTNLKARIASGGDFTQTQFCMDAGVVRRYVERLHECGVRRDFPILIGVAPFTSARSARWIRENLYGAVVPEAIVERLERAGDPRAEGRAICVELIRELATIPGIAGAHVMAPVRGRAVVEVLEAARRALEAG